MALAFSLLSCILLVVLEVPMATFNHKEIEEKWQKYWDEHKTYQTIADSDKKKWYGLVEFPYPSGAGLHVGHVRSYTGMDIITRKRRR